MNSPIKFLILALLSIMIWTSCKKDSDSNPENPSGGIWNILVSSTGSDTLVLATGNFVFAGNTFTVQIKTSRIGGGNIVKEFPMSGQVAGDSILVHDYVLNLTDPVETVTINGSVYMSATVMNGHGTYSIIQPPDTIPYTGNFLVTGQKQ